MTEAGEAHSRRCCIEIPRGPAQKPQQATGRAGALTNSSLQYFVRRPDKSEHGPYERDKLVQLFSAGDFDYRCEVRNALVKQWKAPEEVAPLKPIVRAQREAAQVKQEEKTFSRLKKRISAAKPQQPDAMQRLHDRNVFTFTPAPVRLRVLAGISDLLLVLLWASGVSFLAVQAVRTGMQANTAFYGGFAVFLIGAEMLLAWPLGFCAQTLGQRFWGIMVVRMKGQPAFLMRAFLFSLFACLFGWLTPLVAFVVPTRRALPDILSRTRVVRIRVVSSDSWTVAR